MERAHNFGFAVQAPVGIHEPWGGRRWWRRRGRRPVVVVAAAGWRGDGLEEAGCYIKR